jgi:transcriptional regulator with XRE-family HTH domain
VARDSPPALTQTGSANSSRHRGRACPHEAAGASKARQLTQKTVADILGIAQGDVSKLERRTDAYVGTLRNYIEALGGSLRITAQFPDADPIEIEGFSTIDSTKDSPPSVSPRVANAHRRRRIVKRR